MAERKKSNPVKRTVQKTPVAKTAVKSTRPARSVAARKTTRAAKTSTTVRTAEKAPATSITQQSYLKNPRLWVGAAVVVLAVVVFACKGLFVAAVVNGQPISRLEVVSQLEKQNGKQALSDLVVNSLIFQEAQKRHIIVSQSDVDADIKTIQDQLKAQGVTLPDALAAKGLTQSDLVDQIKLQKLLDKMVGSTVKVTDDDVQAYIDKNQSSLPQDLSEDDLKKQVKSQLEQQQLQDKTQAFVADLQKKAKIMYFVSY